MKAKEFKEYFLTEDENIKHTLKEITGWLKMDHKAFSEIELAASGAFLQNFYNGIENILKRALILKDVILKQEPAWHKKLLEESVKQRIISEEIHEKLLAYLSFRHFFNHGYSFRLKQSELLVLMKNASSIYAELFEFIKTLLKEQ